MITKQPWKHTTTKNQNNNIGYDLKRNKAYILSDEHYHAGKKLLDAVFEAEIAPLLIIKNVKCWIVPIDGDYTNTTHDNMLIAGPGYEQDITPEEAQAGNILRVLYTPEDEYYSYIFIRGGQFEEFRSKSFSILRHKCATTGQDILLNRKNLLTPTEYLKLYQETGGNIKAYDFRSAEHT